MDCVELRDRVLRFVATARRSVHVADVARGLQLDAISVAAALTALTQIGFVHRVRHGRARCRYWTPAPPRNVINRDAIPMGWGFAPAEPSDNRGARAEPPRYRPALAGRRAQYEQLLADADLCAGIQPRDLVAKLGLHPNTACRWVQALRVSGRP